MDSKIGRKAVLVYPRFHDDTFWSFKRSMKYVQPSRFGTPKALMPPLGILGLGNHIRPFYDEILVVDRNVDPRPLEKLVKDADHVYMGGMIAQERGFLEDARIVKRAGKILIAGGTIVDRDSRLMDIADHLVENEADIVIGDLLVGLRNGTAEKFYPGTAAIPERFFQPDFSLIDIRNYLNMALQITRGCPEDCEFCDITQRFGKKPRITPWEYTETSLQQLYNLGWRSKFFLVDDNFIGNPRWALDVLKNLYKIEERIGFHFPKYTELTMRLADESPLMEELREWFRKTKFISFFIGVETNNEDALRETRKFQNLRGDKSMKEKLEFISEETGAGVMAGGIYGFDSDTPESLVSQTRFFNSTGIPEIMMGLLTALPSTKLWDRLKKEGRLKTRSSGNNSDGTMNFIPYNFSVREAEQAYVELLDRIYNPDAFFKRVMRQLQLLDPTDTRNTRSLSESVASVLRILTKENALTFWKYLPQAHKIARERFGLGTKGYEYIIDEYFSDCAKFTHFRGQANHIREQVAEREYGPWQEYSWSEIQESPVASVEVLSQEDTHVLKASKTLESLFDRIRMKLHNGYEYVGTRLDALRHFVEPHIKEGLRELHSRTPSLDDFRYVEIKAHLKAHSRRPEILGNLNFSDVENYIGSVIREQRNYLHEMRHLLKNATAMIAQESHSG